MTTVQITDDYSPQSRSIEAVVAPTQPLNLASLIEMLLKDQASVDRLLRGDATARELVPRLLAVGVAGYTIFGLAMTMVLSAAGVWPQMTSITSWLADRQQFPIQLVSIADQSWWHVWADGSALALTAAFVCGLIGSIGVCLPSFYFYGLLAGLRTNMLQVTTIALKCVACGAIAVIAVLPIYFAVALGLLVFDAPAATITALCYVGFNLPFIAGLWGTRSLYVAFVSLADTMPEERRCERTCFLRRLLFGWSVCFSVVTPVMIFTLWEYFAR